ncbi:uncharacterized protein LOC124459093 [Xenia sp. Carnegie-2017]|uniref:uncharacterized protein LOC124459093 n=1 Tax=Xenia sp. Carnegie-2017 TaxID=2897299 RepID=UPI001F0347C5|nr:uncharacterized protein LOC124459093 [Xenia sp. Carnegie-2017]
MGDEMLTLFYDKEIIKYTKAAEGKNISEYEREAEFRLFRDYFGLIHLVQNCEVGSHPQHSYGDMIGYATERSRLDSMDSDVWSDTSSGGRDFDTLDGGSLQTSPSLAPGFTPARIFHDSSGTGGRPALADVSKIVVGRRNQNVCVFCRNNGESKKVYTSHVLKDSQGKTVCPILRAYTCPLCKATGDESHTIKYCPKNKNNRLGK